MERSTVDRVRAARFYWLTIVCLRIFLVNFMLTLLISIPLSLGASQDLMQPLFFAGFAISFISFLAVIPGILSVQRIIAEDADKEGGHQIQGQGPFFKMLLSDLFKGARVRAGHPQYQKQATERQQKRRRPMRSDNTEPDLRRAEQERTASNDNGRYP